MTADRGSGLGSEGAGSWEICLLQPGSVLAGGPRLGVGESQSGNSSLQAPFLLLNQAQTLEGDSCALGPCLLSEQRITSVCEDFIEHDLIMSDPKNIG